MCSTPIRKQPFVCLDVLTALIEKPHTVDQLASNLEANPQTVRKGLKALETVGLAKRSGVVDTHWVGNKPFLWAAEVTSKK